MRTLQQISIIFILVLLLAALPATIVVKPVLGDGGPDSSISMGLEWHPEIVNSLAGEFINTISSGSLGTYSAGAQVRNIEDDIADNFFTSMKIMVVGVNVALVISLFFGIFVSRFRPTKVFNSFMNALAAVPDFILIIVSMILAVNFYQATGVRIISLRPDAGAMNIWFPMILVGLAPTLYMFKLISVKYYQTSGEDFIRTAVAKGMKLNYINFQHVFKNVEPFIVAELTKIISIAIGNLFIIEYLLNVSGITKFIFQSSTSGAAAYSFQPVAIGLLAMLAISFTVYLSVRLLLYLFKWGFIHE